MQLYIDKWVIRVTPRDLTQSNSKFKKCFINKKCKNYNKWINYNFMCII